MKSVFIFWMALPFFFLGELRPRDTSKFPVPPHTKKSLFYIHRSTNANTVVYEANFLSNNTIDPKEPVNVYWMRYGEKGQPRGLNYLERNFAYGVKCSPINNLRFAVEFVASKERKFEVFVDSDGQACAVMNVGGQRSKLRKIFVQVAEDGWWPKIDYVEFFGEDIQAGKPTYEKMDIN